MPLVLHLTLKQVWFDQITRGVKRVEYRDKKPYWKSRLFNKDGTPKLFNIICFRNGYASDSPTIRFKFGGISENLKYYIIKIGERLKDE